MFTRMIFVKFNYIVIMRKIFEKNEILVHENVNSQIKSQIEKN